MKDYTAKIILDSIHDTRLTTMEVTYPRFVHAEMMTHRMFSRNSASSRAIPVSKMLDQVQNNPAYPVWWGKQQSGMQANTELDDEAKEKAKVIWNIARHKAIDMATELVNLDVHKQLVNRLLEPFGWITVIISATDWANFFSLRCHPDAQPEMRHIAEKMKEVYQGSTPQKLNYGDWHMPYITPEEYKMVDHPAPIFGKDTLKKVSVARCARVSYLTHDGKKDIDKDVELYNRLVTGSGNGHWSPFEHIATPMDKIDSNNPKYSGNFRGWHQFRKGFSRENIQENYM